MTISTIISLVVNILFVLMIAIGFLIGCKRGVKKAAVRFGIYVCFAVLGAVLSVYITQGILQIKFTWPNGMRGPIIDFFMAQIRNSEQISSLFNNNPSLLATVKQLIIVICNLVMFIINGMIFSFIGWIVYIIVAKYALKEKKKKQAIEEIKRNTTNTFDLTPKPKKKYRLAGGLIGLLQGFVFAFLFFLPISGIVTTANTLMFSGSDETQSQATSQTTSIEYYEPLDDGADIIENNKTKLPETLSELVGNVVPSQIKDCVRAYKRTAIGFVGGVGDLDGILFDAITTIKVRGEKIAIRQEILNVANAYSDIVYVYNYDFSNQKIKDLDFEKVDALVNVVTDSKLVSALANDLIPYAIDQTICSNDAFSAGDYTNYVKQGAREFVTFIRAQSSSKEIMTDIKSIYSVGKKVAQTGIVDDVKDGNITLGSVLDKATVKNENNSTLLNDVTSIMTSTESFKILANTGFNVGLSAIENRFEIKNRIPYLRYDSQAYVDLEQDTQTVVNNLISFYNYFKTIDQSDKDKIMSLSFDSEMNECLKRIELDSIVTPAAKILDTINRSTLFNWEYYSNNEKKVVIDELIKEINMSAGAAGIAKYINILAINDTDFSFETEIKAVFDTVEEVIDKDVLSDIFADGGDKLAIFDKFIENPDDPDFVPLSFETIVGTIIDSKLFKPSFIVVMNLINSSLQEIAPITGNNELTNSVDVAAQKQEIITFFNNFALIAKNVSGDSPSLENQELIDSLANVMECLKQNVFKTNGELKTGSVFAPTYKHLIQYLKNDASYGSYFTRFYNSYSDNEYAIDWKKCFETAKTAVEMKDGEIDASNIKDIIDFAQGNEALEEIVKDALKDALSENDDLVEKIDDIDLSNKTTQNVINGFVDLADTLSGGADENAANTAAYKFIQKLDEQRDEQNVETMIEIATQLAGDNVSDYNQTIADKANLGKDIDDCQNLSAKTKEQLKKLFGIEIVNNDENSDENEENSEQVEENDGEQEENSSDDEQQNDDEQEGEAEF